MHENQMADPALESCCQSDTLGLRHISSSLFSIPGFVVGFSAKCSSDSDSLRSPTSPLDLKVFANLSNPFGVRPYRSSSLSGCQKKWDCNKIGLGIVNLLADEIEPDCGDLDSPSRKNIIFGPQVKAKISNSSRHFDSFTKSNSLPRNYVISPLSQARTPNNQAGDSSAVFGNEKVLVYPELPVKKTVSCLHNSNRLSSSLIDTQGPQFSSKSFVPGTSVNRSPLPIGRGSQVDDSSGIKLISLPIPIGSSSHGGVGSLPAQEIELSEDYTCIISHGSNPKTTHIFGDCILECHTKELTNFDRQEQGVKSPQVAKRPEGSTPYPSDDFLSFCYSCKKKLAKDEDIFMYRGEKAFCSFDCRSEEIFAEEEMENCTSSSKSSPERSYHEDLFLIGMPLTT